MIKVSVLYPNTIDSKFYINYYTNSHIPMLKKLMGSPLKQVEINSGIAGGNINEKPPFTTITHLLFESMDSFKKAFTPIENKILADIPNFTNTLPQIQISKII